MHLPQAPVTFPRRFLKNARLKPAVLALAGLSLALCTGVDPAWAQPEATTTTLVVTSGGAAVTTVISGSVVTLTATVLAGTTPVNPGQVSFCDATAAYCEDIHILGAAQLTKTGTATMRFRPGAGNHSYKAEFLGTLNDGPSNSGAAALAVNNVGIFSSSTGINAGGSAGNYRLTSTVGSAGAAAPTGTVSFLDASNENAVISTAQLGSGSAGTLLIGSPIPADGTEPSSVATGDFNGDGILDLAVVDHASGQVTILLGKGDGTFKTAPSPKVSGDSIAAGDFNGDGILDLVVAGFTEGASEGRPITILLGKGDGTFKTLIDDNASPNSRSIAVADFNGDGILDLAVTDAGSNTVQILLGNGDGTFTRTSSPPTDRSPWSVAVGDFNGDGVPDLAVANFQGTTLTIMLGNGDGTFSVSSVPLGVYDNYESVAVGDFNEDGIPDLAVASVSGSDLRVLRGNGDGTFEGGQDIIVYGGPGTIAVTDFNGDGIPDLAVASGGPSGVTVLLGNGDGTFDSAPAGPFAASSVAVAAGDFNGDGIPDLAAANYQDNTVTIFTTSLQSANAVAVGIALPPATGAHQVVAEYPGDATHQPSVSAAITLMAAQGSPVLNLTFSANPAIHFTPETLTVRVSGTGPAPTGTVTIYDADKFLAGGGLTLTNGMASYTTSKLAIGSHSITFTYSGDSNYVAATSAPFTLSVIPATPQVALTASTNVAALGAPVTFTAMLIGSVVFPTGTVSFLDGGATLGTGTLNASGIANFTTSGLSVGSHSITASYGGDANYTAATSSAVGITVTSQSIPTVSIKSSASSLTYGASIVLTATVSGSGASPTGKVTFLNGTTQLGTASLSSSGIATFATKSLPAGADSITATYAGDTNYAPLVSGAINLTVNKATPAINWAAPSPIVYGAALTAAQLNASSTIPGTFAYSPEAGAVLPAGSQTLTASFTPTDASDYTSRTATVSLLVKPAQLTVTASSASVAYGKPIPKLAYTVVGFVNHDQSTVLSGSPAETTTAKQGSPIGSYPITIAQGTLGAANYSFQFDNGTLTVTPLGTVVKPVIKPGTGTYTSVQTVTMTDATPGTVIYYAINGTPTTSSAKYTGAIKVSASETLEAIAVAPGYLQSPVAYAVYTLELPEAALSATAVAFGGQTVNTVSAVQTVTLTNKGKGPLNIADIELAGANVSSFFVSDSCGSSLAGGASCDIWLLFFPTATGADTATLTIKDNALGSPQTVALTGTGTSQ
jgi:hypothetical protein